MVAGRMARAADEMSHYPEYDYIIVNHELEASIEAVHTILKAERLRDQPSGWLDRIYEATT